MQCFSLSLGPLSVSKINAQRVYRLAVRGIRITEPVPTKDRRWGKE